MRFEIKEHPFGECIVIDTHKDDFKIHSFDDKWDAEVLQEMLNDVYNEGFEDGKEHILNNGDF